MSECQVSKPTGSLSDLRTIANITRQKPTGGFSLPPHTASSVYLRIFPGLHLISLKTHSQLYPIVPAIIITLACLLFALKLIDN